MVRKIVSTIEGNPKKSVGITLFCIFIYKTLLALQGFDLVDTGFVLTFYQHIFDAPTSVSWNFLFYLSGLLGGVFNLVAGEGGLLAFNILSVIVIMISLWITFLILKRFMTTVNVIISLFVLAIFSPSIIAFHHDYLTALLTLMTIYFMLEGLREKKTYFLILAGFTLALNAFARIPNLAMLSLVALYFIDYFVYSHDVRRFLVQIVSSIAGFVVGVFMMIIIMKALGHFELFLGAISDMFSTAGSGGIDKDTHTLSNLLSVYKGNYVDIIKVSIRLFVVSGFFFSIHYFIKNRILIILFDLLLFALIFWKVDFNILYIYAFSLFASTVYIIIHRKDRNKVLLSCSAIIFLIFQPIGSDFGIGNMGEFCIWIGLPLFVEVFSYFISKPFKYLPQNAVRVLATILLISYSATHLIATSKSAYFDGGSRFQKTYKIENKLATTYTSKERTHIMDELLRNLSKYLQKGDYLFAYDAIASINYLTQTKPFLNTSLFISFTDLRFEKSLKKSEASIALPIVVVQRF